jgi:glutamyl-tRNA reductase
LNSIQIIAFTHRQFNFEEIGLFHLDDNRRIEKLAQLKTTLKIDELMYLSTCNRVEFIISKEKKN